MLLLKSHVKTHTRRTKTGKVAIVHEHEDSRSKKALAAAEKKVQQQDQGKKAGDDLDPNAKNYRFKDRGYVPGSRKELAAAVVEYFKCSPLMRG